MHYRRQRATGNKVVIKFEGVPQIAAAVAAGEAEIGVQRFTELGGTGVGGVACRLRQAHRRRNREMGQCDPGSKHQVLAILPRNL
jgi:hypothetical protein